MNDSGQSQVLSALHPGESPPHSQSGHFVAKKNLFTLLESDGSARGLLTVPTTLPACHAGTINWHLSQGTTHQSSTSHVALVGHVLTTFVRRMESNFESCYLRAQLGQSRVWQRLGLDETLSRDAADFKMAALKRIDCMIVLDIRFQFSVC